MIAFCCVGPNHLIILLPGSVVLKATRTTIVFPRIQEIQSTKLIPNAVWRSIQDNLDGWPIKVREHKKHSVKEKSSRKLSSELLALTMGVVLLQKNISTTIQVVAEPIKEITTRVMPIVSLKERKSTRLGMQVVLSALDQNSGGHCRHSIASRGKIKMS